MLTLKLAWRNLFRNTRRTVLTVMLIAFSLMSIIVTDGLVIGLVELMVGSITQTLSGEAQIHRRGFLENYDADLFISDPTPVYDAVRSNPDVLDYAPRAMSGAMIASTYNTTGGMIYGVDATREVSVSKLKAAITSGEYLTGEARQILIGKPMAELLEVGLHDRIVLTVAQPGTGEIGQELFRVTGIFKFGPREMDEALAFINLSTAQRILGIGKGIHQIAVRFHDPEEAKNRSNPLYVDITSDEVESLSWLDFNPQIAGMVEMMNYSTLIMGIILFVLASLGIVNSMFMSIYERVYEFGVAKAIGTKPMEIVQLVMLEALLLALISSAVGNATGYYANSWFEANGIPFGRMEMSGVVIDGSMHTRVVLDQFIQFPIYITLLTLASAVYPAVFASRISPSQALQRSL